MALATNSVFRYRFDATTGSCLVVQGTLQLPALAAVEPGSVGGYVPRPFEAVLMRGDAVTGAGSLTGWTVRGPRGYSVLEHCLDSSTAQPWPGRPLAF